MKQLVAILAIIAVPPSGGWAQPPPDGVGLTALTAIERTLIDVIARAEPSVVAIARSTPPQRSILPPTIEDVFGDLRQPAAAENEPLAVAAGVFIDPAGLVLTEYLAVREGDQHTITTIDGKSYAATIRAADPRSGLAVLALASPLQRAGEPSDQERPIFTAIAFGDAAQLRKGQFVIAIGNPYSIRSDGEPTASWGTVTNLARKAPAGTNLNDVPGPAGDYRTTIHHLGTLVQTDAKLGWSAGGGALVNLRGELVGLTTTIATIAGHEQPAGYAIALDDTLRRIIDTLKHGREVEYGLLGVSFQTRESLTVSGEQEGVAIGQVYPGSPADQAGLAPNDLITHVADKLVADIDRLQLAVSTLPPSHLVTIGYQRDGRANTTTATLAKLGVAGNKVVSERPPSWRGLRVDYATALDPQSLAEKLTTRALDPQGCVIVAEVEADTPSWRSGLRPGMFISHVGTRRVATPDDFRAAVERIDDTVSVRLTQPLQQPGRPDQQEVKVPSSN